MSRLIEFSSDNDDERTINEKKKDLYKRRSIGPGPIRAKDFYLDQVKVYSNSELLSQLKRYGENPGPVTESTRKVYEKKLASKLADGPPPPPPKHTLRKSMGNDPQPIIKSLPTIRPAYLGEGDDDYISGESDNDDDDFFDQDDNYHLNSQPRFSNSQPDSRTQKNKPKENDFAQAFLPNIELRDISSKSNINDKKYSSNSQQSDVSIPKSSTIRPLHLETSQSKYLKSYEEPSNTNNSLPMQIIILVACLLITLGFLKYIESNKDIIATINTYIPVSDISADHPFFNENDTISSVDHGGRNKNTNFASSSNSDDKSKGDINIDDTNTVPAENEKTKQETKDKLIPEIKEDPTPEIKEDPAPEIEEDPAPEIEENPVPEVKEESTPEVKEESTPDIEEGKEQISETTQPEEINAKGAEAKGDEKKSKEKKSKKSKSKSKGEG